MPASESTGLQVNFKTPRGTLINVYGDNAADLSGKLADIESLAPQIAALEGVLNGASNAAGIAAPPSQQQRVSPPQQRPEAAPASLPGSAAPTCRHGARTYREGVSKQGKPYKLWACPSRDQNDQCKPQWVD